MTKIYSTMLLITNFIHETLIFKFNVVKIINWVILYNTTINTYVSIL